MSYMLDPSSMVFYTVDKEYDGDDYWTQPKINRQMFHFGEEKLVQGRLYPQDNDGCDDVYTPYRNIVQCIMSVIFDFPNLWSLSKGISSASKYIYSNGTHYEDYRNFDNCSLSRIQGSTNDRCFGVGALPICIHCGEEHEVEDNISCCAGRRTCEHCGRVIMEDDGVWVNDHFYCCECTEQCDYCGYDDLPENMTYLPAYGVYVCDECLEDRYFFCERCGEYHRNYKKVWSEEDCCYICEDCATGD